MRRAASCARALLAVSKSSALALLLLASCNGLQVSFTVPTDSAGAGGGAGHSAGASGEASENSGAAAGAGEEPVEPPAVTQTPQLVCSNDNWTSDEIACAERGGPPQRCETTAVDWLGCKGFGCHVCPELVADFPYYFDRHPCCVALPHCEQGDYYRCNVACPAPSEVDKIPLCSG